MTKRIAIGAVLLQIGMFGIADAQAVDHLSIDIQGMRIELNGGEELSAWMSSGPVVIGKTTTVGLAKVPAICGFAVASRLLDGATTGWNVDVTPLGIQEDAVTFRLRWVRSRDQNKASSNPSGDMEATLRPGESLPIDIVALSPTTPERCNLRAMSVRVAVSYRPVPQEDRRLVSTDLWLIDRQPDGTERSQALSVRGLFNQATPFYFDTVTDGGVSLDLYGEFTVAPGNDAIIMKLTTKGRLTPGTFGNSLSEGNGMYRAREVNSTITLKPGEVVAVQLPRLSENDAGAFANRTFSIRVQTKEIR